MIPRAGQFVKSKAKKGAREDWHPFSENFLPVRGEDVAPTTELCTTAPGQKPDKMNIGFGCKAEAGKETAGTAASRGKVPVSTGDRIIPNLRFVPGAKFFRGTTCKRRKNFAKACNCSQREKREQGEAPFFYDAQLYKMQILYS